MSNDDAADAPPPNADHVARVAAEMRANLRKRKARARAQAAAAEARGTDGTPAEGR